jgi:hypothetical protein
LLDPIFFGPGANVPATNRFDRASGRFGVLYAGLTLRGALAETLVRNPQRLMVAMTDIVGRSTSGLISDRPLRIVRLYGSGLQAVGTDNSISTGPYEPCSLWSDALWVHPDRPDGLAYQSRHDSSEICLAIFEKADVRLTANETHPLSGMLGDVAAVLDSYGKSVSPPLELLDAQPNYSRP